MKNDKPLVKFSELIWKKTREHQRLEGISDEDLASIMGVNIQSLKNYDKSPSSLKLERLDRLFLNADLKLMDLVYGVYWDSKSGRYCWDWEDAGFFNGRPVPNYWSREEHFILKVLMYHNCHKAKKKGGEENG